MRGDFDESPPSYSDFRCLCGSSSGTPGGVLSLASATPQPRDQGIRLLNTKKATLFSKPGEKALMHGDHLNCRPLRRSTPKVNRLSKLRSCGCSMTLRSRRSGDCATAAGLCCPESCCNSSHSNDCFRGDPLVRTPCLSGMYCLPESTHDLLGSPYTPRWRRTSRPLYGTLALLGNNRLAVGATACRSNSIFRQCQDW